MRTYNIYLRVVPCCKDCDLYKVEMLMWRFLFLQKWEPIPRDIRFKTVEDAHTFVKYFIKQEQQNTCVVQV